MKGRLLIILIFTLCSGIIKAQTLKPDVLVIGNGNAAAAAAIQSAVSGVKTTILLQAGGFDISPVNAELSSGIQAVFLKKLATKNEGQEIGTDKTEANGVLKLWTDSIKNLTIISNVMWLKANRSGDNWSFKLSDGRTIKPKILINPADQKLNEALKINITTSNDWTKLDYSNTSYRTSIAAGKSINGTSANIFSLYQLFVPEQENLIWINDAQSMLQGQAAGATAAYAAFFDTKTSQSNLKKIQGELISYKLNLMPFADIIYPDTNWKAIQFVGVTGVLKAEFTANGANFSPDKLVATAEVKQPLKDFYYKAQIWFDDYKNPQMTIASTLELVCYVGNKSPETTKREVEKKWKTNYQFKTELDLKRPINRREFAVLLQDYMPPFNVNVDKAGMVVR